MSTEELAQMKVKFCDLLRATSRAGVEAVIQNLEQLGFFTAPASTRFHGAEPGGLLQHSLNVCQEARIIRLAQIQLRPEVEQEVPEASVILATLLHDVCKAEIYKQEKKWRKDAHGSWENYLGYTVDYSTFPMGHGEKSVVQLMRWGLELTEAEMLAIRWHMGAFNVPFQSPEENNCLSLAKEKHPLVAIVSAADSLASYILEAR